MLNLIPWRSDCAYYRRFNPATGVWLKERLASYIAKDGYSEKKVEEPLGSSDLSRSNWCPGTVTNPEYIYLGDLEAGEHSITVKIPQGAPEGGSNSYWCISGTLIY